MVRSEGLGREAPPRDLRTPVLLSFKNDPGFKVCSKLRAFFSLETGVHMFVEVVRKKGDPGEKRQVFVILTAAHIVVLLAQSTGPSLIWPALRGSKAQIRDLIDVCESGRFTGQFVLSRKKFRYRPSISCLYSYG
jgi:hypothetical protein